MKIEDHKMVKIHYILRDKDNNIIDSSSEGEPLEYMHGIGSLIPGLEVQLTGHEPGDKIEATVEPKLGYGEYNPALVSDVPRSQFDAQFPIEVGQQFQADTPTGPLLVRVTKVTEDKITVDGNHELAGQTLFFEVTIADVRDATEEELAPFSSGCGGGCGGCGGCGGSCGDGCGGCGE